MENQNSFIKVAIQISKPKKEVFEAIVDPEKMKHYFISKSSGRMQEKAELIWNFPEFDMDCPICIGKIIDEQYISYYWDINKIEYLVEMFLTSGNNNSTIITISEKCIDNTKELDIGWLKGNTEGWANFLACLKAYLEYGINLRKAAFDFRVVP